LKYRTGDVIEFIQQISSQENRMSHRKVLTLWNDEKINEEETRILRKPSSEIPVPFDEERKKDIKTLIDTFLGREDGVGLAAPQIGIVFYTTYWLGYRPALGILERLAEIPQVACITWGSSALLDYQFVLLRLASKLGIIEKPTKKHTERLAKKIQDKPKDESAAAPEGASAKVAEDQTAAGKTKKSPEKPAEEATAKS
jgi:hypothetical protein